MYELTEEDVRRLRRDITISHQKLLLHRVIFFFSYTKSSFPSQKRCQRRQDEYTTVKTIDLLQYCCISLTMSSSLYSWDSGLGTHKVIKVQPICLHLKFNAKCCCEAAVFPKSV